MRSDFAECQSCRQPEPPQFGDVAVAPGPFDFAYSFQGEEKFITMGNVMSIRIFSLCYIRGYAMI